MLARVVAAFQVEAGTVHNIPKSWQPDVPRPLRRSKV